MALASTPAVRIKCVAIGVAAGAFAGLFGVGGGSIIVPLALTLPGVGERSATAASLLAITAMAAVGAAFQGAYGHVHLIEAALVGFPAVAGVLAGTALQQRIKPETVRVLFAALLVIVGLVTIIGLHPEHGGSVTALGLVAAGAVGFAAGINAGLLGVGGGALFVPGLVFLVGLDQLEAEATSLLAIVPVSLVGALSQRRYGNLDLALATPIALGSIPGALIGVAVVNVLPIRLVEVLFGLLLLWIAARLLRKSRAPAEPTTPAVDQA